MKIFQMLLVVAVVIFSFGCAAPEVRLLDGTYSFPAQPEIVVQNGNRHLSFVIETNGREKGTIGPGESMVLRVPGGRRTIQVSAKGYADGDFVGIAHKSFGFKGSGRQSSTQAWVIMTVPTTTFGSYPSW